MDNTSDSDPRPRKTAPIRPVGRPKQVINPINTNHLTPESARVALSHPRGWVTRNTPCPCGSGRRFKRCCMELASKEGR